MNFYVVRTLGCKANLADSQQIESELLRRGWAPYRPGLKLSETDRLACVINSCTVTDEADRQTRRLASRLSRESPQARVIVTGCAAEVDPERLRASRGVHYVVGNRDKPRIAELITAKLEEKLEASDGLVLGSAETYMEMASRHPIDRDWPEPEAALSGQAALHESVKTRAFLKIQEGCNAFCTYCVIPYGRGPSRSLAPDQVISRIQTLVAEGVREVVLTGTNIGDYGTDFPESDEPRAGEPSAFTRLCERIFAESALERLRLGSLDPMEIEPALIELLRQEPARFCAHFHVSLQSPLSRILKLMKRKYAGPHVERCLEAIAAAAPHAFVGMDVITGFPGETPEDFEVSIDRLRALPWSRLHVFPYSERSGTPATRLPGSVRWEERLKRSRVLNALGLERLQSHYAAQREARGSRIERVLFERPLALQGGGYRVFGYSPDYLRVAVETDDPGRIFNREFSVQVLGIVVEKGNSDCHFTAVVDSN